MGNVRVFQLARELNLSSQEVIDRLRKLGMDAKTASSSVDEDSADKLKRAVKIDALTSRKKRIYGSEEDEAERELQREAQAAKIQAEREAREKAAEEARLAAERRKKPRTGPSTPVGEARATQEASAVLTHVPGAPRLAPRVAQPPASATALAEPPDAEMEAESEQAAAEAGEAERDEQDGYAEAEQAAAPAEAEAAAPVVSAPTPAPAAPFVASPIARPIAPVPPPSAPVAVAPPQVTAPPAPIAPPAAAAAAAPAASGPPATTTVAPAPAPPAARLHVPPPRVSGPLRPIAPPPPPPPPAPRVPPPAPVSASGATGTPAAGPTPNRPLAPIPRPLRPIAPPRPIPPRPTGPHPTSHGAASSTLPRSPHATTTPGARTSTLPGARPMSPIPRPGAPTAPPGRPGGLPPRPAARRNDRSRGAAVIVTPREERPVYTGPPRRITLSEGVTVKELSDKMPDVKSRDIMKTLIGRGVMATINLTLPPALAIEICKEFGYEATIQSFEQEVQQEQETDSKPEDLVARGPVVTVMGHVDHGKTSLLDAIRTTKVAAGEAGGITQHIGAYHVDVGPRKVVFLDTPGHEAFTLMRARGARVTDVVVLVVAADDGMMPQTIEAIDHAKAAGVPIVVAVNKIDKPNAQPDRVRQQLSDKGLQPEEWGGTTVFVNVSAKKKQNIDQLLEMLLLVADLQDLKANPKKAAIGTVIEARLDKGRGPVATVLVQDGTLSVGDSVVVGAVAGKVRALVDDQGNRLKSAGPATPVEILGLGALPEPGDQLLVITDTAKAQAIVNYRQLKMREKAMAQSSRIRLEDLGRAIAEGQLKELPLVVKADVQGSVEAVSDQLMKLPQDKIKLRIIRSGAGAITEGDVLLAAASNAVVIGFNVRPERKASDTAERDKVEVRLYTVIYDAMEDIKKAMEGLLEPTIREVRLGGAEVRDSFKISKVGTIAGCLVMDGKVNRNAHVRLLRDNVVIHTGRVQSLKRFKDDVTEVAKGMECGIGIANYNDIKPGDVIEFFTTEKVKETLE